MWQELSEPRAKRYQSKHALKQWFFTPEGKQWPIYSAAFYPSSVKPNLTVSFAVKRGTHLQWESWPIGAPPDLFVLFLTYMKDWLAARNYDASSEGSRPTSNKRPRPTKSTSVRLSQEPLSTGR